MNGWMKAINAMSECNEWMNEWLNGWMDEWVNDWMQEWKQWVYATNEGDEWTNEWMTACMNEWLNEKASSTHPTQAPFTRSVAISVVQYSIGWYSEA